MAHAHLPEPSLRSPAVAEEKYASAVTRMSMTVETVARCPPMKILAVFQLFLSSGMVLLFPLSSGFVRADQWVKISAEVQIFQSTWQASQIAGQTNNWSIALVCTVGTNEWKLDGDFSQNAKQSWSFDGTNVCNAIQIVKAPDVRLATNKTLAHLFPPLETVNSNLTVNIHTTAGGYPVGDIGVNIPWLAFCSGTYLKRVGRIIPLPVAIIGHTPDVFAYSDRTVTFDDELGLPRTVELFTSKQLLTASVRQFSKDISVPTFRQDGERRFHYTVTQSTNYFGWNFPVSFEFGEDIPQEIGGFLRRHHGSGRITAITDASRPEPVFDTTLHQTVVDWRFRSDAKLVNSLAYRWTNSFVAPTSTPALQARFAAHLDRAPARPGDRPGRERLVVLCLFALATSIALLFLWKARK